MSNKQRKCRECGAVLRSTNKSGLCTRCGKRHYMAKYMAEKRAKARAEKESAMQPGGGNESAVVVDSHPSDTELAAALAADPQGQGTVVSRQQDGSYRDLRSGRIAATWEELI